MTVFGTAVATKAPLPEATFSRLTVVPESANVHWTASVEVTIRPLRPTATKGFWPDPRSQQPAESGQECPDNPQPRMAALHLRVCPSAGRRTKQVERVPPSCMRRPRRTRAPVGENAERCSRCGCAPWCYHAE